MAADALSLELKNAGKAFIHALDAIGLNPQGVLWLHFTHLHDWRLTVVSDLVDHLGRRKVYSLITQALAGLDPVDGLTAFDIHLASSDEVMPQVLGGAFRVEDGMAQLSDCRINDMPVDAVIYRLLPPRSKQEIPSAAKRFERDVIRARVPA